MNKFVLYFLICLTSFSYAQDQLFKRDSTKLEVKILEIFPTEIKYKLFSYQDGPIITISKKDVALIIYQNGIREVIAETNSNTNQGTSMPIYKSYSHKKMNSDSVKESKIKTILSSKNYISMNVLESINGSFNISYLREFLKNYINLYVPLSIGFSVPHITQLSNTMFTGTSNNYDNKDYFNVSNFLFTLKTYDFGIGLHLQTSGNKRVTYLIGPYIGYAQYQGTYNKTAYTYDTTLNYTSSFSKENKFKMYRQTFLLDNGVLFKPSKNFGIMLIFGLGYHMDSFKNEDLTKANNYRTPEQRIFPFNACKFAFNLGYRF